MSTGVRSKNVDLDSIFAPYVTGTSPAATGVKFGGTDVNTRYAPRAYGSQAAATGIKCKPGGAGSLVDLNTLFAAYGTTSYALAIDGQSFTSNISVVSGTGWAQIGFYMSSPSAWYIQSGNSLGGAPKTLSSGAVPAGAVKVKYVWGTPTYPTGTSAGGSVIANGAPTPTLLTSEPGTTYQTGTFGSNSASRQSKYPFQINFYDGSGSLISTTNIFLIGSVEGSS